MPATTPAAAPASTADAAVPMLEALGAELEAIGLRVRLVTDPGRVPVLHVTNPAAAELSERICAAPREAIMCFWWSWAEPIAPGIPEAAVLISRVLRSEPAGSGAP
jgi:hypothetical protein